MTSHGISEPIKPPSGSLDDGDHPHGPHSSKRVRFTESNDESPQADRGSMRYRLHDRLTRISKRPYLCNSIFLKSMGITFSPGSDNHTATAHEDATNGNGTRLPLWYLSYPGLRLDYMQTLMAQLGWTSDPTPFIPFRYRFRNTGQVPIGGLFEHEFKGRCLAYIDLAAPSIAANSYRTQRAFTDQGRAALRGSQSARTASPRGEHPFVAPALIALAQLQEREPVSERRAYLTVHLIASPYGCHDVLFVYTAEIPFTLLDSLWEGPIAGNDED